jgi:hypothetical protein
MCDRGYTSITNAAAVRNLMPFNAAAVRNLMPFNAAAVRNLMLFMSQSTEGT